MRIKEFLLNSQNQVVCKVVREVLNLFKMELPVPVEKLPYRKSPEKQAELISNAAYDILELKIENFTESVPGETTSSLTERLTTATSTAAGGTACGTDYGALYCR